MGFVDRLVERLTTDATDAERVLLSDLAADAVDADVEDALALLAPDESSAASNAAAAAALALVAERDPSVVAPHADALVAALDHDDPHAREHLADALCLLARDAAVPVDPLFEHLTDDDSGCRGDAAAVLGVVAAARPGRIPLQRLRAVADDGDDTGRAAAQYLLAVLAADHPGVTDDAVDLVSLARAVRDADLHPWLDHALVRDAIPRVADDATDAAVRDVAIAETPTGTQLKLHVDDPDAVDADAVGDALDHRLGLSVEGVHVDDA